MKASQTETRHTISVPEAGERYFGMGRDASYQAAHRGEIPVIKIGGRLFVPVAALERMLEMGGRGRPEGSAPVTPLAA